MLNSEHCLTITNLTTTLKDCRTGDALYLDLDDTVILNDLNKYQDAPHLTENNLIEEIKRLRQSGVKVYALTARELSHQADTLHQLENLSLDFDEVIHAPIKIIDSKRKVTKGEVLKAHLAKMEVPPKRVIVTDDNKEQLDAIAEEFSDGTFNLKLYHYQHDPKIGLDGNNSFPMDLSKYEVENRLGGGTQSTYLLTSKDETQPKLVFKHGSHDDAIKLEILHNEIYRVLGVNVPRFEAYHHIPKNLAKKLHLKSNYGMFKVTEYLQPESITENTIKAQARADFLAHVLLGNIDIAKLDQFIYANNQVYIIDAGANFMLRSLGGARQERKDLLSEFDSLRDAKINHEANEWFGSLTTEELQKQGRAIISKLRDLERVVWTVSSDLGLADEIREEYLQVFASRLEQMAYRLNLTDELGARKDKEAVADETAAGILTYTTIDGKAHILLSKRVRHEWWANFGGQSDKNDEQLIDTAKREVKEESSNLLSYTTADLNASVFHELVSIKAGKPFVYRLYLVEHEPIDLSQLKDQEHTEHQWVNVADLVAALENPTLVEQEGKTTASIQLNDKTLIIYPELFQLLKQPAVIEHLKQLAAHAKLTKSHTKHKPVFTTPKQKREEIAKTLLAHSDVLRELKQRNPEPQEAGKTNVSGFSQSELHLKAVLKEKYKENDIRANVELMLEESFKNQIPSDTTNADKKRITNQLVQWIENEKRGSKDYIYYYHGCDSAIAFAYEIYTKLYEGLKASNQWPVFRAQGHFFKEFPTIDKFIEYYSNNFTSIINNNATNYNNCALSTNVFLFGNYSTQMACSVSYMLLNYIFKQVNLATILSEMLLPFSVSQEYIQSLLALYEQHAKQRGGALYQLALSKEDATNLSYAAVTQGELNLYNGTYDLVKVLNQLQANENNLTEEQRKYILNLQSRLMLPPNTAVNVNVIYQKTAENAGYDQALMQVINLILNDILIHVTSKNRYHLEANLTLFKHNHAMSYYNQIPEQKADISVLMKAIIANNDTIVIQLLKANPKWKEAQITNPEISYDNNPYITVLRLIVFYSKLKPQTIISSFGDNWWQIIKINTAYELTVLMDKVPMNYRLAAAIFHQTVVRMWRIELNWLFNKLDKDDKLAFANAIHEKITDGQDLASILENLEINDRLIFMTAHQHKIQKRNELLDVLNCLKVEDRLNVLIFHSYMFTAVIQILPFLRDLRQQDQLQFLDSLNTSLKCEISDFDDLSYIVEELKTENRLEYANAHCDLIQNVNHLNDILNLLLSNERLNFAKSCQDKIQNSEELAQILLTLRDSERLDFAIANLNKIKNDDDLKPIFVLLNDTEIFTLKNAIESNKQINTFFKPNSNPIDRTGEGNLKHLAR